MGIPLLKGMYGDFSGGSMVQIVVLQCIIWYTLMLFMFEYRCAKILISEQFPHTAASIVSIHVDSDVLSLDGWLPLETETQVQENGRLHVTVRKSNASRSDIYSSRSNFGFSSTTPRPSNLTNAGIYSLQSSRNPTPRGSSFNQTDFYSMMGGARNSNFGANDVHGLSGSSGPTPRPSNFEDDIGINANKSRFGGTYYPAPNPSIVSPTAKIDATKRTNGQQQDGGKDVHMFVWSSSASQVSENVFCGGHDFGALDTQHVNNGKEVVRVEGHRDNQEDYLERHEFSFGNRANEDEKVGEKMVKVMPLTSVTTWLILIMIWRKLGRNPNTYSSLIGLTWSLVSFRHVEMSAIIAKSISILSDAGLGMALLVLVKLLTLHHLIWLVRLTVKELRQILTDNIVVAGNGSFIAMTTSDHSMWELGCSIFNGCEIPYRPAVLAAASIAIGLRGVLLRVAIVQHYLKELSPLYLQRSIMYTLSTWVIFGMLIVLPVTLVYYILFGLLSSEFSFEKQKVN